MDSILMSNGRMRKVISLQFSWIERRIRHLKQTVRVVPVG